MSTQKSPQEFEALLDYLKHNRGFDFTAYKRSTLTRRVDKRMQQLGIAAYGEYTDYLQVHPEEFTLLFNTILINLTSFFRDPPAWEYLAKEVIPSIIASKRPYEPIRAWSAGCASGEETYTLAMVLYEALGEVRFRERVKIYATDLDEEALSKARLATYSTKEVGGVDPPLLEKYFERVGDQYAFRKDLRRSIIFGRHDLLQDAPISRVDLLVCRNTLMYFHAEAQQRILARLHFALNDTGALLLGKAETLLTYSQSYTPLNLKWRVFAKVPKANLRDRLLVMAQAVAEETIAPLSSHTRLREAAFDTDPVGQIVLDHTGHLLLANEQARTRFGLNFRDLGRPIQDLEISYRPVELRTFIEQAIAESAPVALKEVRWPFISGEERWMDIDILPLLDNGSLLGVKIAFSDVTRYKLLQEEHNQARQELETAYEELQSTNEELETTNEELQSTIEELETTNEELQSTNEELETVNEELQSTNEELETLNDELQERTRELDRMNNFLQTILSSLRVGVVVLDPNLSVLAWNRKAEDLWGLRLDEVQGKHFLNLDLGLPVDQLRQPLLACLSGQVQHYDITLGAINRRGKPFQCRVTSTPLGVSGDHAQGLIVLMDD